jgi:hexosaminidase
MLERLVDGTDIDPLRTLADVVEPVKGYKRGTLHKYTQFTPLNRLVDATRPESDVARRFGEDVTALLDNRRGANPDRMRRTLERWRDNDARLRPQLDRSHLLAEVGPLSAELMAVANIGLEALDAKQKTAAQNATWKAERLARLKTAEEPRASVLIMIVPHVRRLVESVPSGG